LFLDELPEFSPRTLEVLRQPLEDKVVTISRAQGSLTFPANFQLVAAMNPCPCGYYGDHQKVCTCSAQMVTRYQKRISGPLLDRIDIHVEVPRVEVDKLSDDRLGEPSAVIQQRVEAARQRQRQRFERLKLSEEKQESSPLITCNAEMSTAQVRQTCVLDEAGKNLMRTATTRLQLSARAYHRVLKVARTIADLEASDSIQIHHLAEALQYRPKMEA
jgi:magnesium chelatase family protein